MDTSARSSSGHSSGSGHLGLMSRHSKRTISHASGFINPWQCNPLEAEFRHERPVTYAGEVAGSFSFCLSIPAILMRCQGSVIPNVYFEVLLAGGIGALACFLQNEYAYDEFAMTGHQIAGVSLAFLTVFRSQTAWGMYMEGRNHIGSLIANTRHLAIEVVGTLSVHAIDDARDRASREPPSSGRRGVQVQSTDVDFLALELVRLLKLFFYTVVEHVRSTDGPFAWEAAAAMVDRLTTAAEKEELELEFGKPNMALPRDPLGARPRDANKRERRAHDPTRAKPLLVLLWLRVTIERMHLGHFGLEPQQLPQISERLHALVVAFGGIDKIDKLVLPFPYAQLLKLLMFLFVFSLPFFVVAELGWATPPTTMVVALAFYGLDSVGAELEGPFGVDENDLPLLAMGMRLNNDLDAVVRSTHRLRFRGRAERGEEEQRAAAKALCDELSWPLPTEAAASSSAARRQSANSILFPARYPAPARRPEPSEGSSLVV